MSNGLLNMISLVFGLIAVVIPILNLFRSDKSFDRSLLFWCVVSIGFCAVSLVLQLFSINYLANINDFSAIYDLIGFISQAAFLLVIITISLNIMVCCNYDKL